MTVCRCKLSSQRDGHELIAERNARVPEALHLAVQATRYGCPGTAFEYSSSPLWSLELRIEQLQRMQYSGRFPRPQHAIRQTAILSCSRRASVRPLSQGPTIRRGWTPIVIPETVHTTNAHSPASPDMAPIRHVIFSCSPCTTLYTAHLLKAKNLTNKGLKLAGL